MVNSNQRGRCVTCEHPDSASITARMAAGESIRAIGRETGLDRSALMRHLAHHVPQRELALARLGVEPAMVARRDAMGALEAARARVEGYMEAAHDANAGPAFLAAAHELRSITELILKLDPPPPRATDATLAASPEFARVMAVLDEILEPAQRERLAEALR